MILQAIKISNQFYLNNFLRIFQTCILSIILVSALSANSPYLSSGSSIVSVIVSTFLQVHLTCMLMMVTADIINNSQQSVINYYFKSVFYIVPLLLVGLIVGFVLILGFVAFLLPGIYLLGKLIFAQYFLILRGKGILESIELSWEITSEKAWNLGLVIFSMVLMWGLFITSISSLLISDSNVLEPSLIFFTSIFSFIVLNIYLNTFLIHLFIIEENQ
jgi:hypothetical protein